MTDSLFYLVVPPGLENLALSELSEKFPGLQAVSEKGGVLLTAPFEIGLAFHHYLKIPTEIRLRIAEFKCRDLPKLYQKVSNIRWGQYLLGGQFTLSVASSKSRLLNEKKIAASVAEGIARHFQKQPPKKVSGALPHEVHVRFFDDQCTISMDLAGAPLYQRGYKAQKALAPIRENLGAALFYALWLEIGPFRDLLDPLCGTGTFLLEAERFWQKEEREFLFSKHADWKPAEISILAQGPRNFFALDKSEEPLKALRETLSDKTSNWNLVKQDVLKEKPIPLASQDLAIISNPPYGERLKLPLPPKEFYPKLMDQLISYQPKGIGLILPKQYEKNIPERIAGYHCSKKIEFKNGGLSVVYGIWKR